MDVDQREKTHEREKRQDLHISTCNFGQSRDFATSEKKCNIIEYISRL